MKCAGLRQDYDSCRRMDDRSERITDPIEEGMKNEKEEKT